MSLFRELPPFSIACAACSCLVSAHVLTGFSAIGEGLAGSIGSTKGFPYELLTESTAESGRTIGETAGFNCPRERGTEAGSKIGDLGGGCERTD